MTRHVTGTMADYVVISADRVAPMPPNLPLAEALSLVVPDPTAVRALRRSARLKQGERILVRGASGGMGLAVVQLAVAMGATVTTLSAERDLERLRCYGVERTLDYRTHTAGDIDRFDVIVDAVGCSARRWCATRTFKTALSPRLALCSRRYRPEASHAQGVTGVWPAGMMR